MTRQDALISIAQTLVRARVPGGDIGRLDISIAAQDAAELLHANPAERDQAIAELMYRYQLVEA